MNGQSLTPQELKLVQLKEIFPEAFAENKVDWEKLKATLGEDVNFANERYVLNWAGKSASFKTLQTPTAKTLTPCKTESIDFDKTNNIFIEGENLEVLKILQKSYFGKVKMIYIDPPYNTGKDSFVYPDKFSETIADYQERVGDKDEDGYLIKDASFRNNSKENGQYHSNWLSMMYPRLFLAKNLLKQDGVIFISIDDNEVHNLRLLMNEVFGEDNFVAEIVWRKSDNQANIGNIARVKEYILLFCRSADVMQLNKMLLTDKAKKEYRYKDKRGYFRRAILLDKTRGRNFYKIQTPSGKVLAGPWMKKEQEIKRLDSDNRIYWTKGGQEQPYGKIYLAENKGQIANDFLGIEFGSNQQASLEVESLFGKRFFDFPKSITLIKHFLTIGSNKKDVILDFFAGSGTTAHAVMQLNAEDGGKRQCISVQLPELTAEKSEAFKADYKTIAEISKERIRRAGTKIASENPDKQLDTGFKVFKLAESNFKQWQQLANNDAESLAQQIKLFIDPVAKHATTENMLVELLLKSGKNLNSKIEFKEYYICVFAEHQASDDVEIIFMLEQTSQKIINAVITEQPQKVIALDRLFNNNDQLKTNTVLQMQDAGIEFKTI